MLLAEVKENDGWLESLWELTYPASWEQICKAAAAMYDFYEQREIWRGSEQVDVTKEGLRDLEEAGALTIRGISTIVKVPLMLTFYNQVRSVRVIVAGMTEEFRTADYEKFNKSMGQYLDSVELVMHR